jgi:hypothetical protein
MEETDRHGLADQKEDILRVFPRAKTLVSIFLRMNREPIRSPARSIANLEFHHTGDEVNHVARRIVRKLQSQSIGAINPAMGFPMEMDSSGIRKMFSHVRTSIMNPCGAS